MTTPYHPPTPWPAVNLPTHYDGMTFPSGPKAWLDAGAKAFRIIEAGGIVLLNGAYGTGKTFMAKLLAEAVVPFLPNAFFPPHPPLPDHRRPIVYHHAGELMAKIKAGYSTGGNAELMDQMSGSAVLILDELSKATKTNDGEVFATLIDARYRHNRPTILVGNYDLNEIQTRLDGSTLDRIREVGGIISCDWPGFRGRNADSK